MSGKDTAETFECIYCREKRTADAYKSTEHVMPQAFGRFRNSEELTLNNIVCDGCNRFFSRELELYFGRDTIEGLDRFRFGLAKPEDFKTLGARSTRYTLADSGPYAGALVEHGNDGGVFVNRMVPQVGFSVDVDGPFRWFRVESLPSDEEWLEMATAGFQHIRLCEIVDPDVVLKRLDALKLSHNGAEEFDPNTQAPVRMQVVTVLTHTFGRTLTKIALNYLASQCGAEIARMPQFDEARMYVREGRAPARRNWTPHAEPIIPGAFGHAFTVAWDSRTRAFVSRISFHGQRSYTVRLADGGFVLDLPDIRRAHFFDVNTKQAVRLA